MKKIYMKIQGDDMENRVSPGGGQFPFRHIGNCWRLSLSDYQGYGDDTRT